MFSRSPVCSRPLRNSLAMTAVSVVALGLAATMAVAQQTQQRAPSKQSASPAAQAKQAAPAAAAEPAANDAGLRRRIEQLEEQLVDMQVMIGTLESLAKSGGNAAARVGPASGGGDDPRVPALESQVRSLQSQVDQLTQQLRAQGGARQGAVSAAPPAVAAAPSVGNGAFGSTTVQPDRDPIAQIMNQGGNPPPAQAPAAQSAASDASSKQLYETAYSYLLNQDYASAEASFDDFLKRYPNDALAGNAQYWLGESFFVRGQFKPAANAFLKGYQTYGRSSKAPDSLLKLAMSLDRLGQRDAACSSYGELGVKFPNAPGNVKSRAESERRRLGCV